MWVVVCTVLASRMHVKYLESALTRGPSRGWRGATSDKSRSCANQCPDMPMAQHPRVVESSRVWKNIRRGA